MVPRFTLFPSMVTLPWYCNTQISDHYYKISLTYFSRLLLYFTTVPCIRKAQILSYETRWNQNFNQICIHILDFDRCSERVTFLPFKVALLLPIVMVMVLLNFDIVIVPFPYYRSSFASIPEFLKISSYGSKATPLTRIPRAFVLLMVLPFKVTLIFLSV